MYENLINKISQTTLLPSDEIALLKTCFEPIFVSKNTIIEAQGKIPEYLYFVNSGYLRLFYTDQNDDAQTTFLCSPNGFIASFLNFIHQSRAAESVECITDCELLRANYANLKKFIDEAQVFKLFSVTIFEQAMSANAQRANDLATLTAEQRYKKLLEQQPQLLQHIPLQHIASFLGIKPESLSRIRRQMIS